MADKSINDLNFAPGTIDDANTLFVVSQSGTAYKVSGHEYITALGVILDGHGGIKTISYTAPVSPSLDGTLTITLADDDVETLTITNGKGFASSSPVVDYWARSSSNSTTPSTWHTTMQTLTSTYKYLWHYQHYAFNDGTSYDTTKTVIGVYGDKGDNSYVWIRYSGSQPTQDSDMGDTPDNWMGIYAGTESDPSNLHYTDFEWFKIKGETGETGDASAITMQDVSYQVSDSGQVAPSGSWTSNVPNVPPGKFLWTRTQLVFNDGTTVTSYSVSRFGIDGTGAVSTVNQISPDGDGNISLTALNIPMVNNESVETTIGGISSDVALLKQAIIYPTGDQTDRAAEIATKLSTYGYCEFVKGDYYIGSTITIPNRCTIKGCGKESKLIKKSGSASNTMFYMNGSNGNATIKDLYFAGTGQDQRPSSLNNSSGDQAIVLEGNAGRVTITNCTFYAMTKFGIYYASGFSWYTSVNVTNCEFLFCNIGLYAAVYGEFANIANCNFNSNYYGAGVVGGNNKFVNCGFEDNNIGFYLYDSSGSNDGHGSAVGCTFDHNTSRAIKIENIDNGFLFSSSGIFYGDIEIINSKGIQFENCLIMGNKYNGQTLLGHSNFILNSNPGLIAITDCCSTTTNGFTITKTGTNSHVFAKGNKTRDGALIAPSSQSGEVTGNSTPINSYTDKVVTFPIEFSSVPNVQVTQSTDLTGTSLETGKMIFMIGNVTTTGFTIRTYNNSASLARTGIYSWYAFVPGAY